MSNVDKCIFCGDAIPEGRQTCPRCAKIFRQRSYSKPFIPKELWLGFDFSKEDQPTVSVLYKTGSFTSFVKSVSGPKVKLIYKLLTGIDIEEENL